MLFVKELNMAIKGFRLSYEDVEIDELLGQVKNKTVYEEATVETAGLLSASDKELLDDLDNGARALTNKEIERLLSD